MLSEEKKWKIRERKPVFSCAIFDLFELDCYLPSKQVENNFISIHGRDWVNVFALTEDKRVVMVKQHRLGKDLVTMEVPAGLIEKGEDPAKAARRELLEETGYSPGELILLKKISVNPAIQDNNCYFYLGLDCVKSGETDFDHTEEMELVLMEKEQIFSARENSLIENSVTLLSIMLAKDYLFIDLSKNC